ncbi:MAG TPA: calcium/sodium antiporter [Nocardioidaceae bacterium]
MSSAVLLVVGFVALVGGAELLVRAGTGLATWAGIRPMVIGLTVVSIGTSVPELAIGIDAATTGSPGLAVGNIVGTNLVNILLILGLSALILPIAIERRTLRFDLPAMTIASLALFVLALDGNLSKVDGILLCLGGVAYTWGILRTSRREGAAVEAAYSDAIVVPRTQRPVRLALGLLVGIAVIVVGAELLVDGAVATAEGLGISEAVIGLTVVAVGTSAPELVTTIVSTVRGDRDIAIGNLVGSTIYNIAIILGLTTLVAPGGIAVPPEIQEADLVLLAVVAVLTVPVFVSGARISRAEGGVFVVVYVAYVIWLLWTRS